MDPLISVVVPTCKRPELLSRCINALKKQTIQVGFFEIIMVHDGPAFSDEYARENCIRFFQTAKRSGPAAARNFGWKNAKGKLILFTDDDCIPESTWVEKMWLAYLKQPRIKIAFTGKTIVPISKKPTDYEKNISGLETAAFITANCAISREALQTVNGFDENFETAWREDSDMQFRLIRENINISRVPDAVVIHPVRKAPWGISLKEQKKSMYNALLFKKYPDLYRQQIAKPIWTYYAMVSCFCIAVVALILKQPQPALIFFFSWFILLIQFINKRLKNTEKSFGHVTEMVITSILIPFLSVYWTLYGSFRYKTVFL